jgi:hypothetical protein
LTNKFHGLTHEVKNEALQVLILKLNQRVELIAKRYKLAPDGCNEYMDLCYHYDTAVALFLLIANAFKGTMSAQAHVLATLDTESFQLYLKSLNKFINLTFGQNTQNKARSAA